MLFQSAYIATGPKFVSTGGRNGLETFPRFFVIKLELNPKLYNIMKTQLENLKHQSHESVGGQNSIHC